MSKAEVLSKGQITIPIDVRNELHLQAKSILVFEVREHKEVRIFKDEKNENVLHSKATVTEKGQITIPKYIRDFLQLQKGDTLLFSWINYNIYIRKQGKIISCPVCNGVGSFEGYELPCFICDQSGQIEKHENGILFLLLFQNKLLKYKVGCTIIQHEIDKNGKFIIRQFPKIILRSTKYPEELLNIVQDSLQMSLVEEHSPKSVSDSSKFMTPSDSLLIEILELFVTDEAKQKVEHLFRGD